MKSKFNLIIFGIFLGHALIVLFSLFNRGFQWLNIYTVIYYMLVALVIFERWSNFPLWLKWSFAFIGAKIIIDWSLYAAGQPFFTHLFVPPPHEISLMDSLYIEFNGFMVRWLRFPFLQLSGEERIINGETVYYFTAWKSMLNTILNDVWVGLIGAMVLTIPTKLKEFFFRNN